MTTEDKSVERRNQNYLTISGLTIPYQRVSGDRKATIYAIVKDPTNQAEIESKVRTTLLANFWFLDTGIRNEQLHRKYRVFLEENMGVDIYSFQADFSDERLNLIANTLARYYQALKDKSIWNLESIQLRSTDQLNKKSGKAYRGLEYPDQRRFELFPASFGPSSWGSASTCVEAATAHEVTHVILGNTLNSLWNLHLQELGWEILKGKQVLLPGGATTTHYNNDYQNLPSEYAAYSREDDQAETVTAYLFDQTKLNSIRKESMTQLFLPVREANPFKIVEEKSELPKLPTIIVNVSRPVPGPLFVGLGTRGGDKIYPIIPLEEYRQLHQK